MHIGHCAIQSVPTAETTLAMQWDIEIGVIVSDVCCEGQGTVYVREGRLPRLNVTRVSCDIVKTAQKLPHRFHLNMREGKPEVGYTRRDKGRRRAVNALRKRDSNFLPEVFSPALSKSTKD